MFWNFLFNYSNMLFSSEMLIREQSQIFNGSKSFYFAIIYKKWWKFKGILSFSHVLWRNVYLVLSLFRDNLFALNHWRPYLVPSWQYEKVLLRSCVKRKGLYHTAQKSIFSFSKCFEKMVFPKKSHWNMIFLVLSGKRIFLFPKNMILFFRHKRKDDLSQKIPGNMFSSNVRKRLSFQKNRTWTWSFL